MVKANVTECTSKLPAAHIDSKMQLQTSFVYLYFIDLTQVCTKYLGPPVYMKHFKLACGANAWDNLTGPRSRKI